MVDNKKKVNINYAVCAPFSGIIKVVNVVVGAVVEDRHVDEYIGCGTCF